MSALGKTALSAESRRRRLAIVLGLSLLSFASIVLAQPIPQDPAYHNFADQRHLLGIPHMWNAVSNLPFAVTGAWGCWWLFGARGRSKAFAEPWERTACFVFFFGEFLTCFGSGYYHADPNNQPHLAYSKLPSTCLRNPGTTSSSTSTRRPSSCSSEHDHKPFGRSSAKMKLC